jgi:hypothetical protein
MNRISKCLLFGTSLLLSSLGVAHAGTATRVNGLYYTGVDDSGGLLSGGTTDSHWTVTNATIGGAQNSNYQGAAYVISTPAGGWVANTSSAQWITAPGNGGSYNLPGNGTSGGRSGNNSASYVYSLAFNIVGSGDIGSAVTNHVSITLTLAADDQAQIYINNVAVGSLLTSAWTGTQPITLHNYNDGTAANANFLIGTNTLSIRVDNTNSKTGSSSSTALNPSGLLVYQTGSAILIDGNPNPVPEVGVLFPIIGALGLFGWRRYRLTKPASIA